MKQETKTSEKPAQPTLTLDADLYKHYLDESDLTEEQKQEVLETLWNIVCEFVQMGFHVHPVQQAQESRTHTITGEPPHADL